MKPLPAARIRLAHHTRDLGVEAVVLRRLRRCVDLEVLRDRVDIRTERGDETAVGEIGRQHDSWKQDHAKHRQ
jgi:hypothetical protein